MAPKPVYDWPDDDTFVREIADAGSIAAWARARGIQPSTASARVGNRQLRQRVQEAIPIAELPDVPVDDPARVKAVQDAATIKSLRRENQALEKALAKQEEFFDRIVEATRVPVKPPRYRERKQKGSLPANSVVCPIYDQQFGQFVQPSDTPGNRGNFSVEVFDQRLARWVDGATGIIAKRAAGYRISELVIPFGGDHVEGDEIFAGQPWQLELDPPRQVWELALKMDSAIREVVRFAKEEIGVPWISLYGVTGNHGKVGGKRGGARPATYNWDWLFLKILFDRLRGEPIDEMAIEPGGALFFRCAGHEFQAIHGDEIRGWGSLPFYGLSKFDGRSIRLHSRLFRYLLMGHHHQRAEVPNGAGETIVSADWVGANNLGRMITAASRPSQSVLFVAEKWGLCGSERIWFQEAAEAHEPTTIYGQAA